MKMRCRGHESNIRNMNVNLVSNNYGKYNHTVEDYIIHALYKERDKHKSLRLEKAWMILLNTISSKVKFQVVDNVKHNNTLYKPTKINKDLNWNDTKVELHITNHVPPAMHIHDEIHEVSWTTKQHIWNICKQIMGKIFKN